MDAVAAVEDLPKRSGPHQSAEVESRYDDGRPKRVRAKVSAAGFKDEEVTDYVWDGLDSVTWTLAESSVQSVQVGTYTLTPTGSGISRLASRYPCLGSFSSGCSRRRSTLGARTSKST